jgi:N6-adenosine-specific RNA methylase IME4
MLTLHNIWYIKEGNYFCCFVFTKHFLLLLAFKVKNLDDFKIIKQDLQSCKSRKNKYKKIMKYEVSYKLNGTQNYHYVTVCPMPKIEQKEINISIIYRLKKDLSIKKSDAFEIIYRQSRNSAL